MRVALTWCTATLLLASPTVAQQRNAAPALVFAQFRDLCLENAAVRETVVDEAGSKGWAMQMAPSPQSGNAFNVRTFHGTGAADGIIMVLSDKGADPGVQVCTMTSRPKGNEALAAEVRNWVGFADNPKHRQGSVINYFYVETEGRRRSVADAAPQQQREMLEDGSLRILWVSATKRAATVSLSAPRRSSDNPSTP